MASRGLGRGLDALIPAGGTTKPAKQNNNDDKPQAETNVKISRVEPRKKPRNNRKNYYG